MVSEKELMFKYTRYSTREAGTILVNLAQACLQCDWQTCYHKGTYYGKQKVTEICADAFNGDPISCPIAYWAC